MKAHVLLKELVITHRLFNPPHTSQDHDKLIAIYESFHTAVLVREMKLADNDDVLWQLFRAKLDMIQKDMLKYGEVKWTPEGYLVMKPQKKLFLTTPGKEAPLSTPPTTPILPTEQLSDGLEVWKASDANAQVKMFRRMLRTAKDPQRLIFEYEQYCTETCGDKNEVVGVVGTPQNTREASTELKRRASSYSEAASRTKEAKRSVQRPTPAKTPDISSAGLDLQAMLDKSMQERKMKKELVRLEPEMIEEQATAEKSLQEKDRFMIGNEKLEEQLRVVKKLYRDLILKQSQERG